MPATHRSWPLVLSLSATIARSVTGAATAGVSRTAFSLSWTPLRSPSARLAAAAAVPCPRISLRGMPSRRPTAAFMAAVSAMPTTFITRTEKPAASPAVMQLTSPEYSRQSMPGDGSCLFHSVAASMGNPGVDGASLRSLAAAEVSRLRTHEINGATIEQWIEWETGLSAAEYARRMSSGGSWGGQVELALLAQAVQRPIEVYREDSPGAFTREHSFGEGSDAIRLVYSSAHYDALVRTSTVKASAGSSGGGQGLAALIAAAGRQDRKYGQVVEGFPKPEASAHTATVIWLHGLGDTGFGWSPVTETFNMPWVKFIFPTAPVEPVTLNGGMEMPSWFDLVGLNADDKEDSDGMLASAAYLTRLVDAEIQRGIPASRIVIAGFSQGGAIALTAGFGMAHAPVAGVIAASTWLPSVAIKNAGKGGMGGTPLLMCHGEADPVVIYKWGKMSYDKAVEMGVSGEFKSYPGMPHSFCPEEMKDCAQFLQRVLPKK